VASSHRKSERATRKLHGNYTFAFKEQRELFENLDLALDRHVVDVVHHTRNRRPVADEVGVIQRCKRTHDHLAVHSIYNTSMAWEQISKVLDIERALSLPSHESLRFSTLCSIEQCV
jgi:hypothetical protein